jgi:hypothetical protein
MGDLAAPARPLAQPQAAEARWGLTAVEGSLRPALPKMAWALGPDPPQPAAQRHIPFEGLKGVPTQTRVTAGTASERDQLRATLAPGGCYVSDRGYRAGHCFQELVAAGASFVARGQDHTVMHAAEERPVPAAAHAAGVVRAVVVQATGPERQKKHLPHPLRLRGIATGNKLRQGPPARLVRYSNRLDLPAALVAMAYRDRCAIERFFRWFQGLLGHRPLRAKSRNGVSRQIDLTLLARLLSSLWVGRPPLRTWEMLQISFSGGARAEELRAQLDPLKALSG